MCDAQWTFSIYRRWYHLCLQIVFMLFDSLGLTFLLVLQTFYAAISIEYVKWLRSVRHLTGRVANGHYFFFYWIWLIDWLCVNYCIHHQFRERIVLLSLNAPIFSLNAPIFSLNISIHKAVVDISSEFLEQDKIMHFFCVPRVLLILTDKLSYGECEISDKQSQMWYIYMHVCE